MFAFFSFFSFQMFESFRGRSGPARKSDGKTSEETKDPEMFAKMFPGAYVVILKIFSAKNWRF
jgi:hypothetical protein